MALHGRDIVCLGFGEWDAELWTNQQHLMARLGRRNRVLFLESLGLRQPRLAGRDLRRMARRVRRAAAGPRPVDGLHVLSPLVIPLHGRPGIKALNARLLRAQVGRAARQLGLERPLLWSYVPQAEWLVDTLRPSAVVYHCVDDIAAQKGVQAAAFRTAEARFAARADLVLASAPALAERMRTLTDRVFYAPNVADTERFATALEDGPTDAALAALARPRIVFTGAVVATKLDLELLEGVARARPGWSIALVGPVGAGDPRTDVSVLERLPNVHLLGSRPYAALPEVLRGADVALVPYAINELTRSVFPMKVYEYLAAGLPVVTTPLPALHGTAGVQVAADAAATVAAVERALAEDGPAARRERSTAARGHSWEARLDEIDSYLSRLGRA
ncbi:MAG: glycosyltransferase [Thermoleophilaceae bacterium]|nr:glycosyltransferase [Thermoleophilaceae bacterium]